ncbi:hypothetical protein ABK040_009086 [Willaertia magna]
MPIQQNQDLHVIPVTVTASTTPMVVAAVNNNTTNANNNHHVNEVNNDETEKDAAGESTFSEISDHGDVDLNEYYANVHQEQLEIINNLQSQLQQLELMNCSIFDITSINSFILIVGFLVMFLLLLAAALIYFIVFKTLPEAIISIVISVLYFLFLILFFGFCIYSFIKCRPRDKIRKRKLKRMIEKLHQSLDDFPKIGSELHDLFKKFNRLQMKINKYKESDHLWCSVCFFFGTFCLCIPFLFFFVFFIICWIYPDIFKRDSIVPIFGTVPKVIGYVCLGVSVFIIFVMCCFSAISLKCFCQFRNEGNEEEEQDNNNNIELQVAAFQKYGIDAELERINELYGHVEIPNSNNNNNGNNGGNGNRWNATRLNTTNNNTNNINNPQQRLNNLQQQRRPSLPLNQIQNQQQSPNLILMTSPMSPHQSSSANIINNNNNNRNSPIITNLHHSVDISNNLMLQTFPSNLTEEHLLQTINNNNNNQIQSTQDCSNNLIIGNNTSHTSPNNNNNRIITNKKKDNKDEEDDESTSSSLQEEEEEDSEEEEERLRRQQEEILYELGI